MDKDKKTLTQNKLARLLRPLGIIPKEIGEKEARKRGYHLNDFREAFERYTTPKPDTSGNATVQPSTNVENTAEFPLPQPSTAKDGWTIGQTESLNKNKGGGRLDGCKPPLTADGGIGPWEWPGLSPRAVAQLAREVAGLRITGAARIEAEIKTRLASSGVPAEVQDIEVEKVVRQIEARQ